ncbi:MAG: phosphoribosylamine--glycine ligase [Bacteroidales bacterium]|nr:phosphoribosylamine--glycine ligase [Bacteroidales bacterium]
MNVLIIGGGGREHTLAWKMSQGPLLERLYTAPGNGGTSLHGENLSVDIHDFSVIRDIVRDKKIGMVVVGPEEPLVNGIVDFFRSDPDLAGIPVIGPDRRAAMLEGSKDFAKGFMAKYNIPTAQYKTFTRDTLPNGQRYLQTLTPPYVLKADGLAAGKGVLICPDLETASDELDKMLAGGSFGKASRKVVIEEYLDGVECSVFVLTDGFSYRILPPAKDYKRVGEGDTGPNTGGMGSISGVPFVTDAFMQKVERRIIIPTMKGIRNDLPGYKGFIFFGLMNVGGNPFVVEYNVRMGDPEAEAVLPRIRTDILELFDAVACNRLGSVTIDIDPRYAAAVMLVSRGYPGSYEKGKTILGTGEVAGSLLFHAGTRRDEADGRLVTSGGRVIAVTSMASGIQEALDVSYRNAEKITFEGKYYRKDLGRDILAG